MDRMAHVIKLEQDDGPDIHLQYIQSEWQEYIGASNRKARIRDERYTQKEKDTLINAYLERADQLEDLSIRPSLRTKLWKEIADGVCRIGHMRTVESIKRRYQDCKREVKEKMAKHLKEQVATGGGSCVIFRGWEELLRKRITAGAVSGKQGTADTSADSNLPSSIRYNNECTGASREKERERAERYTPEEKEVLIREVMAREDLLWNNTTSFTDRNRAWREITAAVCHVGYLRSVTSVKQRFRDCRLEVKKKMEQAAGGENVTFFQWEEQLRRHLIRTTMGDTGEHYFQQLEESQNHQEEELLEREIPEFLQNFKVEDIEQKIKKEDSNSLYLEGSPHQAHHLEQTFASHQDPSNDILLPPAPPPILQPLPPIFRLPPVPPQGIHVIPSQSKVIKQLRLLRQEQQREIRWQMRIYAQQERLSHQMATMNDHLQHIVKYIAQTQTVTTVPSRKYLPASSSTLATQHLKYVKRRLKREASRLMHKKYKNHKNF
ncbi:uncharacterized protein LOC128638506 [Bombina bombina]|uniref:uncharacterized protein LOC128638506 n=1 Tax=Bombina bombina TaxID=8345 RepID=UPI00235A787C|nr:uncharacterized protein LOC128638506 [Bombina bombina]